MANYQHPGVYIQELPASRSIQAASTSVAAFVGVTERGPVNTPTLITSWAAYVHAFGNVAWQGFNAWAVYTFFQEGGDSCYVVRLQDAGGAAASLPLAGATLLAASNGAWGNRLRAWVSNSDTADATPQQPRFRLSIGVAASALAGGGGGATQNLAAQLLASYVQRNALVPVALGDRSYYVLEHFDGLTSLGADAAQRINAQSMFIRIGQPADVRPANTIGEPYPFSGGMVGTLGFGAALDTLKAVRDLNLLAMPDSVNVVDSNGNTDTAQQCRLINASLAQCDARGSVFQAVDPPFGQGVQDMLAFKQGTSGQGDAQAQPMNSSYGALYYPWVWIDNPQSTSQVPIPPSGVALGRYAHTDSATGVWISPAGIQNGEVRSVVALAKVLTDADQEMLNPNGINALRTFTGYGNVIYGARTLSQDPQWRFLCVRRLCMFVEQSLKNSLQWVVFEQITPSLWVAANQQIQTFLTMLWQQGALFGATAQDAFFVTCDASNNPPGARGDALLHIDIGLAAVHPAEFVIVRIAQQTAGPELP